MGKSFFSLRADEALATMSQAFTDQIVADAESFGITEPMALAYQALNDDFQAKLLRARCVATRTRACIIGKDDSRAVLRRAASRLSKQITGNPLVSASKVLGLGLAVRERPSPMAAPGTPGDFKVELLGDGSVKLRWTCKHPRGMTSVVYDVWRTTVPGGARTYLGASGTKSYVDYTIPAGHTQLTYHVRAQRPTGHGDWANFEVRFGGAVTLPATGTAGAMRAA